MLEAMRGAGYDLGPDLGPGVAPVDGEAIVRALRSQEDQRAVLRGARGIQELCAHTLCTMNSPDLFRS